MPFKERWMVKKERMLRTYFDTTLTRRSLLRIGRDTEPFLVVCGPLLRRSVTMTGRVKQAPATDAVDAVGTCDQHTLPTMFAATIRLLERRVPIRIRLRSRWIKIVYTFTSVASLSPPPELNSRCFSSCASCSWSLVARKPANKLLWSFCKVRHENLRWCDESRKEKTDRVVGIHSFHSFQTGVQPLADSLLCHFFFDEIFKFFTSHKLLQLQRLSDVHRTIRQHTKCGFILISRLIWNWAPCSIYSNSS